MRTRCRAAANEMRMRPRSSGCKREQSAEKNEAARMGIFDPIGGSAVEYDDTFNRIRSHLLRWLPVIREAVERRQGVR